MTVGSACTAGRDLGVCRRARRARSDHGRGPTRLAVAPGRRLHGSPRDPSDARHLEGAQSPVRARLHAGGVRGHPGPHRRGTHPDGAADHRARGRRRRRAGLRGTGVTRASREDRGRMKIVVTARNGTRDFECDPGEKILLAALGSGIELPYECATGTCGTCKARLTSGRAESAWPEAPGRKYFKAEGDLLTCQSVAHQDCALEVGPLKTREPDTSMPRAMGGGVQRLRRLTHDGAALDAEIDAPR